MDLTNQVNPSGSLAGTVNATCIKHIQTNTCTQRSHCPPEPSTSPLIKHLDFYVLLLTFPFFFLGLPSSTDAELVKLISSLKSAQASSHKAPSQGRSHRGTAGQRPSCSPGSLSGGRPLENSTAAALWKTGHFLEPSLYT